MLKILKDRFIRGLLSYLISTGVFIIVVGVLGHYFGDWFKNVFGFMLSMPQSYRFFVLFLIQDFLMIGMLGFAFMVIFGKTNEFFQSIYGFFKKSFKWVGSFDLLVVFCLYWLYLLFIFNLQLISQGLGVGIPGFFGEQGVANLIGNLKLVTYIDYILIFISVVAIGPLIEELIYRGFITEILLKKLGKGWGIFVSSLIFAGVHMEWSVFGNLFILSLILSYIYQKTGSIYYSYFFHILINASAFIALVVMH